MARKPKSDHLISMVKRPARRVGEIGLFADNQMAEEDLAKVRMDVDLAVTAWEPQNLADLKHCWAIAAVVAESDDRFHDRTEAMDWLKVQARHYRMVTNPQTAYLFTVPRSLTEFDGVGLRRFKERIRWIVLNKIMPGVDDVDLQNRIDELVTGSRRAA